MHFKKSALCLLLLKARVFSVNKTKKIQALKQNHLFQKVYKKGSSHASGNIVLYALRNYDRRNTLVGITVAKNRGNAVIRNRIRRRIKEAYRVLHPFVKEGFIIVLVARKACAQACSTVIQDELYALLKKAALLSEDRPLNR